MLDYKQNITQVEGNQKYNFGFESRYRLCSAVDKSECFKKTKKCEGCNYCYPGSYKIKDVKGKPNMCTRALKSRVKKPKESLEGVMIYICATTRAGKDLAVRYLMDRYGLKPIVSYATRPIRPGEVDGREHYFISEEKADELLSSEEIMAYTKIEDKEKNAGRGFRYFTTKEDYKKANLYVVDIGGIKYIEEKFPEEAKKAIKLLITADLEVRQARAKANGEDLEAFRVRVENETEMFTKADYDGFHVIENNGTTEEYFNRIDEFIETVSRNR